MTADKVRLSVEQRLSWHCRKAQMLLVIDDVSGALAQIDEARRLRTVLQHWPKEATHEQTHTAAANG